MGSHLQTYQRRAPPGADAEGFRAGPPAGQDEAAAAAWDRFWGWDCCGPGGLCERVYARLHVAPSSWTALKMLPAVRWAFSHARAAMQMSWSS